MPEVGVRWRYFGDIRGQQPTGVGGIGHITVAAFTMNELKNDFVAAFRHLDSEKNGSASSLCCNQSLSRVKRNFELGWSATRMYGPWVLSQETELGVKVYVSYSMYFSLSGRSGRLF